MEIQNPFRFPTDSLHSFENSEYSVDSSDTQNFSQFILRKMDETFKTKSSIANEEADDRRLALVSPTSLFFRNQKKNNSFYFFC